MNWIHPEYLWTALLLVPVTLVVLVSGWWHRRRVRDAFGDTLFERVLPRSVRARRTVRDVGALLALLGGAFALAEPAFDKSIVQQKVKGVDLVIALDLSRSMDAQDVDPSRLERARREIVDLVGLVTGDRVGLVFFAGEAIPRLPLTEDYKAVQWVLAEASTDMFAAQGSNLARAIEVGKELLGRDEGKAGKAMVVFSDGESNAPDEAAAAAEAARQDGVVIYTVGIGDAKAPIPTERGPLRHQGQVVYTETDFSTLREVAGITEGAYVKSVASASDMRGLYDAIRDNIAAVERDSVQHETWNSAYQVPLFVGLMLWMLGAGLGDGKRRFAAATAVLLAVSLPIQPAFATTAAEADALYRDGRLPAAERAFEELTLERPNDADLYRRLGTVRYRMGDYVGAASAFERADQLSGGDPDALYNAGNARYRAGQLETAIERYDQALEHGDHQPSQANRQLVEQELQARRAEQPPPPPEPSDGGEQDEDEGDQGDQPPQDQGDGDQEQQSEGGQQGDDSQKPQNGDQQEGQQDQPQDGSADSQGDPGQQQQEGQQGDPGDQPEDPGSNEAVDPDELDAQDGEPQDGDGQANAEGDPGQEEMSGNITPAQAARMIDGVEEGQRRVRLVGPSGSKPW